MKKRKPEQLQSAVRVVLVEPEYEINLGHVARAMANFGFEELYIVNPKVEIGFNAKMFAKHASHILENAKIVHRLEDALKGCGFVVGTTGIIGRGRNIIRNPITPAKFARDIQKLDGRFALLFGREGTGLNQEEIRKCDFLLTIQADEDYPVLNLSHALAIVLYEISSSKRENMIIRAGGEEKEMLTRCFDSIVDYFAPQLRSPGKIKLSFKRVIGRSLVSDVEAAAILCALQRMRKKLKIKK
ncbi:MAG: RNA methyltransferase [Candidatus Micrarchaeota archaeon]|nr:RNA methyltransferase [Candidatus Micrarchaeota archaeon]